jgi:pyruvate/2-oxoglutarate/acetoin dehydrogenase E1 component
VHDELTYSQAFQRGLREEMERDETVFVLGTDLYDRGGHFGQVLGLGARFGRERIRDAPISEAAMVAAGVGAALNGMRPVIDLNFVDFAFGAMDEIANQAAKLRSMIGAPVPLVLRATSGVAAGAQQHNNSLEAWFAHMPGLLVAVPATPEDCKGLIKTAVRSDDPVVFLMHKRLGGVRGPTGGPDDLVPLGHSVVRRPGRDVTIVSYSATVGASLKAAEALAADGIEAEVIDLRTLLPLDLSEAAASVERTGRAIVASDAPLFAGIGAEIAAELQEVAFGYLDAPVSRVGALHAPVPHSPPLLDAVVPGQEEIEQCARSLVRWSL